VEIEVPVRDEPAGFRTHFFWGCSCTEVALLYEQPALKAVRFLQGLYGFVILITIMRAWLDIGL
jgi:hypothetical protein